MKFACCKCGPQRQIQWGIKLLVRDMANTVGNLPTGTRRGTSDWIQWGI